MSCVRVERKVRTAPPMASARVLEVAMMFGLGIDDAHEVTVVPASEIPLSAGGIVLVTGPSGGGKSTILRLIARQCRQQHRAVIHWDETQAGATDSTASSAREGLPLIDALGESLVQATSLLSMVGLGDAFVMLRRQCELSDGQRARFRLACMIAKAQAHAEGAVLLADEFLATLDRLTARTVAANLRRWITPAPHTFIAATTHDDLLEPLAPDVLVFKGLGDRMEVLQR